MKAITDDLELIAMRLQDKVDHEPTEAILMHAEEVHVHVRHILNLLKEVVAKCSYEFRKRFLEKQLRVLIESQPDRESGSFCGYSENYIRVIVGSAAKKDINKLLQVKIKTVDIHSTKA